MAARERDQQIEPTNAAFRAANERIRQTAGEYALDGLLPFICECAEPGCTRIARLTLAEYAAVRAYDARFFILPGHEPSDGDTASVVESHERYVVVEKPHAPAHRPR